MGCQAGATYPVGTDECPLKSKLEGWIVEGWIVSAARRLCAGEVAVVEGKILCE